LPPGVEELELGVGDAAKVGVRLPRLPTVAIAHDLDQPLAGVYLLPQPLAQLAISGGPVILGHRVVAEDRTAAATVPRAERSSWVTADRKMRGRSMMEELSSFRALRAVRKPVIRLPTVLLGITAEIPDDVQ